MPHQKRTPPQPESALPRHEPAPRQVRLPTDADFAVARQVVSEHLLATPLVKVELLNARADAVAGGAVEPAGNEGSGRPATSVLAKLDTLQPTGSFKVRGALAAVAAYASQQRAIVTVSAGNHGLGIVYAAARLGVSATVVVPETASAAKRDALRRMGATLVESGADYDAAEAYALSLANEDVVFVSAYNDPHVISGQATWVAEVIDALPSPSTLVVPVGGGGLLAGTVLAAAARTDIRVVGVEAAASRAVSSAVAAGRIVAVSIGETLADGLAGNIEPGCITPGIVGDRVHSFVAVTESEIEAAIRHLAFRCGLVVEGAGAVGIAALMVGKVPLAGRPVVLLTGRNIAPTTLGRVLLKGDL